ncbi:MAG: starch-binding protein [Bacteroides sp.]|nr:starch-binding protein [Bacteroides sp.]MCM1095537.1 starch-binding protein [Terasakiella sp.]
MKRLYTMPVLLACVFAFLGLSASAQDYYIRGDFSDYAAWAGDNWGTAHKMTPQGDGSYIYEFTQGFPATEFKISDADWNNGNTWSTDDKKMVVDKSYDIYPEQTSGEQNMSLATSYEGKGRVVFRPGIDNTQGTFVIESGAEPTVYTVYFTGDLDSNVWKEVCAYVWDGNEHGLKNAEWPGLAVELTDKYFGGKAVYKYEFSCSWKPVNIIFNNKNQKHQTNDLDFTDKALYVLGAGTTNEGTTKYAAEAKTSYTFDTEAPQVYSTLYMDFGADRQTKGKDQTPYAYQPKVILLDRVHTGHIDGNEITGANTYNVRDMVKVSVKVDGVEYMRDDHDLWSYTLTDQEKTWVKDAIFYFQASDGSNDYYQTYCCGMDVQDKGNLGWDQDNWLKYMYFADNVTSADGIDNQGKATQSYITFDQYKEEKWSDKEAFYFIGQGLEGFNEWKGLTSPDIKSAETEMNVAYLHVVRNSNPATSKVEDGGDIPGILFKMSWLKPYDWWVRSGESGGAINEKRAWATFNYGIIGFDTAHPTRVDRKLNLYIANDGENNSVHVKRNKSYPVNNSNQYNWFIAQSSDVNEAYLIVDLDPSCQSATMLSFEPNPQVQKTERTVSSVEITPEQLAQLGDIEQPAAAGANGEVVYTSANIVNTRLTVLAAHHNEIKNLGDGAAANTQHFTIQYQFFCDSVAAGKQYVVGGFLPESNTFDVTMDGINAFAETNIGVRALYTYSHGTDDEDQYKIMFHSKFIGKTVASNSTLPVPAVGEITDACFVMGPVDNRASYGVFATLPVSVDESTRAQDFVRYLDFELASDRASGPGSRAEILHASHSVLADHANLSAKAVETLDDWASQLSPAGEEVKSLPLVLTDAFDWSPGDKVNVTGKVSFIFPVLVNPVSVPEVAGTRAPQRRAAAADLYSGYQLKLRRTEAPVSFALGTGQLTGIEDVETSGSDAPAEYYDLRGVRLAEPLAPGVYIRRCGSEVTKVLVK